MPYNPFIRTFTVGYGDSAGFRKLSISFRVIGFWFAAIRWNERVNGISIFIWEGHAHPVGMNVSLPVRRH